MAVRTAYAPVAATVLTAANLSKLAGGWIGYAEVTANQGSITTAVDLTGLTVTVTVGTTRRIRITSNALMASSVAGDIVSLSILADGTTVGTAQLSAVASGTTMVASAVLTPAAGARVYKLQAARASGTGTVSLTASSTAPAFILVEDIGPAS